MEVKKKVTKTVIEKFDIGKYWADKKAITVPENKDDGLSALYSIAIAMLDPENKRHDHSRITKDVKKYVEDLNLEGVSINTNRLNTEDEPRENLRNITKEMKKLKKHPN